MSVSDPVIYRWHGRTGRGVHGPPVDVPATPTRCIFGQFSRVILGRRKRKRKRRRRRSGVIDEYGSNEDDAGHSPTLQINNAPRQPVLRKFPVTKISQRNRSFSPKWYSMYPWISYSITTDEATCFACSKFGYRNQNQFIFKKWSATTRLEKHAKSVSHENANKSMALFQCKKHSAEFSGKSIGKTARGDPDEAGLPYLIETLVFVVQQSLTRAYWFRKTWVHHILTELAPGPRPRKLFCPPGALSNS